MDIISIIVLGYTAIVVFFICLFRIVFYFERADVHFAANFEKRIKELLHNKFPEEQHSTVMENLEQYRIHLKEIILHQSNGDSQPYTCVHDFDLLVARIQLKVLTLSDGDLKSLQQFTAHPELTDYRGLLMLAGENN